MSINFSKLKAPFPEKDITWRIGRSGVKNGKPWAIVLAYVDARAVQDRLDEACSPENWQTRVRVEEGGILTELGVKCGDEWVYKTDGSPETQVEAFKGGISKSLVRAASAWGVGRYLYDLGQTFAEITEEHAADAEWAEAEDKRTRQKVSFYWRAPKLPAWALPEDEKKKAAQSSAPASRNQTIAPPKAKDPAPTTASPESAATEHPDRAKSNRILMNLYRPYLTKFPETRFIELLIKRYGVGETRLCTLEQLHDLIQYMEGKLRGDAVDLKIPEKPLCERCGAEMALSKKGTHYTCPNWKQTKDGEHNVFEKEKLREYLKHMAERNASKQEEGMFGDDLRM